MLNPENFDASTRYLREQVQAFTTSSMDELLSYSRIFAVSRKPHHTALLLKSRFDSNPTDAPRDVLKADMEAVIDQIVEDRANADSTATARADKRLAYLQSRKDVDIERDVVIQTDALGYRYPNSDFYLESVSLRLRLGEITGIVGENANGKTTLFRLLVGERKHQEGTLCYPGLGAQDPDAINWTKIKSQIAYVPQSLPVWYGTIQENLRYAAAIKGIVGRQNDWELHYIAERLGLNEYLDSRWTELSGGFKLRCALAQALIWKPKVLALDEPLANLDFRSQLTLLRDIRDLADSYSNPISVALSSQHLHEVEAVADRILFLANGKVVYHGDRDNLGETRQENTFELGFGHGKDPDLVRLRRDIKSKRVRRIVFDGMSYVVTTDRSFESKDLLELLVKRNIPVRYFRDISTSVKQLFEQDEV